MVGGGSSSSVEPSPTFLCSPVRRFGCRGVFECSVKSIKPPGGKYSRHPHRRLADDHLSLGILEYILQTPSSHRMHHRPPGNCAHAAVALCLFCVGCVFLKKDGIRFISRSSALHFEIFKLIHCFFVYYAFGFQNIKAKGQMHLVFHQSSPMSPPKKIENHYLMASIFC